MTFLIDFENVSNGGFEGLENLTDAENLILFYSDNAGTISIATHRKLEQSVVQKEYLSVKTGGKNALDFQLATYLGYLISQKPNEDYCIVSNDEGFQHVVNFWEQKGVRIIRCANLLQETRENAKVEVKKLLPDFPDESDKVAAIVHKYKTKQGINNALMKEFGSERTGIIYKALRPMLSGKKDR